MPKVKDQSHHISDFMMSLKKSDQVQRGDGKSKVFGGGGLNGFTVEF